MKVLELKDTESILKSFSVMKELRAGFNENDYVHYVQSMQREGYRLFGLFDGSRIVAVAGLAVLTNLYYKRHIWVYDLVTLERERSKGYGLRFMQFIDELARKEKCQTVALSSGLERTDAHRFYEEKTGYSKSSYVFKKTL